MPKKNSYSCPITHNVFSDPVKLPCGDIFEKEALFDFLEKEQVCPSCNKLVTDDKQIQSAFEMNKTIESAIKTGELNEEDRYVPRLNLFNYLLDDSGKNEDLIREKLLNTPQLMAYFLWECKFSSNTETIINKLSDLNVFTEITINQSIIKKIANRQENYSVSYLLLSTLEGRKTLNKNPKLCELIDEKLSEDFLKQFIHDDTHEGTLYYLLDVEIGKKILTNYPSLKDKIMHNKNLLLRPIISGEHKGKSLHDLYDALFPSVSTRPLANAGFFSSTSSNKQPPKAYAYQSENKI